MCTKVASNPIIFILIFPLHLNTYGIECLVIIILQERNVDKSTAYFAQTYVLIQRVANGYLHFN